ncbi:MAG: phosphomannomutase/phosphoglucomutase [Parcubacteria group bacterium]|nr:phosphomannomutase/phosphoglucomutase [Parcubacteria group bacterium]
MNAKEKMKNGILPANFATAFKPADIRGVYPDEMNEEVAYRTARAFVSLYSLREIFAGRDMRLSSPAIGEAFIRGARDQGANVIDIGLIDTPAAYFFSGQYDSYGVMITASHNPKEFNGLKLVKSGAVPLTETDGLDKIKSLVVQNAFSEPAKTGTLKKKAISNEYKKYLQSLVLIPRKRRMKVVIDAGNGMATLLAPIICGGFPVEVFPLFFELDGSFPNRGSDPTVAKNQKAIQAEIKKVRPDFGVAFDGDVDRAAFFDERGKAVNSSFVGALIAKHLLQKNRGAKIAYTNFTSRSFLEAIQRYGGTPIRAKVGHSFIKKTIREEDAAFACELSAHFYFKENYYADSGILAFLRILEEYADTKNEEKKFSELTAEFDTYHQTEEELLYVKDKEDALARAAKIYTEKQPLSHDMFDGFHAEFPTYWFTLAKSITEDALKLVLEAVDEETMLAKQKEVLEIVQKIY